MVEIKLKSLFIKVRFLHNFLIFKQIEFPYIDEAFAKKGITDYISKLVSPRIFYSSEYPDATIFKYYISVVTQDSKDLGTSFEIANGTLRGIDKNYKLQFITQQIYWLISGPWVKIEEIKEIVFFLKEIR